MAALLQNGARGDARSPDWSETVEQATAPTDDDVHYTLVHPLDSPLASFNNHSGAKVPIGERVGRRAAETSADQPEDPISPIYAQADHQGFAGPHSKPSSRAKRA